MQECRHHGVDIEVHIVGGDGGHGNGVQYVGLAPFAPLWSVSLAGEGKGVAQTRHIFAAAAVFHQVEHVLGTFVDNFIVVGGVFHCS